MAEKILVAIVWFVAVAGIGIMKKIQPDDKIYPVWAVMVCILLTLFVGWHGSWLSVFL